MTGSNTGRTSVFIDGTEVLGFIVYGLWSGVLEPAMRIDYEALCLTGATIHPFRLIGDGWTILGCDIGFHSPDAYSGALSRTEALFDCILSLGAHVAWMGYEGLPFADPPRLFTDEWMEGGVLAGKTRDGVFRSGIDATTGHSPLNARQMSDLEEVARFSYGEGGAQWRSDADQYGDLIVGKRKGGTGLFIPSKALE
jgi:hypothetical protein